MPESKEKLRQYLKYINFTKAEKRAVIVLTVIFLIGGGLRMIKILRGEEKFFDNSKTEASFVNVSAKLNSVGRINPADTCVNESVLTADTNVLSEDEKINLQEKMKTAEENLSAETGKDKKKSKKEQALTGITININTAGKDELMKLPGVGESMADKIIQFRNEHNGFKKSEDIMKVKGIGKKKFEKIKPYITVN
jgi:competence protein ComEA